VRAVRSGAALLAAIAALAACAHGPIRGQLVLPDRPPRPATLSYESNLFGKTGRLWAAMPTGETFTGSYLLDASAPDRTMLTTLAGDRGSTMACRFRLNEPGVGPDKGGAVTCDISTGGTFQAAF
jgi:hypothetical protein